MKLKFLDSRVLGQQNRRGRKPKTDGQSKITVAPHSARVYLSIGLVQRFKLLTNRFGLAIDEDSGRVFFYIDNEYGFTLNDHHRSFYVHSKITVNEVLTEIVEGDQQSAVCFLVEDESIEVGEKAYFELSIQSNRSDIAKKKAKAVLKYFNKNDFLGRIKTTEVLQAERILNPSLNKFIL